MTKKVSSGLFFARACKIILLSLTMVSDAYSQEQSHNINISSDTLCGEDVHIECKASKYDGKKWSSLGSFKSPKQPNYNDGELSCNAEFSHEKIRFSAAGDFTEGLLKFGSIYDYDRRIGTQVQRSGSKEIWLYLLLEREQYSLTCRIQSRE